MLTPDDQKLWRLFVQGVTPLPKHKKSKAPPYKSPQARPPVSAPLSRPAFQGPTPPLVTGGESLLLPKTTSLLFKPLDRLTSRAIKAGRLPLQGRLDLHGMTQNQAYEALSAFLSQAVAQGLKRVLVITGKGSAPGSSGVLQKNLPVWLENRDRFPFLLSLSPAHPADGGLGAFYVFMRRSN